MVDKKTLLEFLGWQGTKNFKIIRCNSEDEACAAGPLLETILGKEPTNWKRGDSGRYWEFIFLQGGGDVVDANSVWPALWDDIPHEVIFFEDFISFAEFGEERGIKVASVIDVEDLL